MQLLDPASCRSRSTHHARKWAKLRRRKRAGGMWRALSSWGICPTRRLGTPGRTSPGSAKCPACVVALLTLAVFWAACGADLSAAQVQLEEKRFRFDTSGIFWNSSPERMPEAACEVAADCCASMGQTVIACEHKDFACEAGTCALRLTMEQSQPAVLARDVPDLALATEQVWRHVRVGEVVTTRLGSGEALSMALALEVHMVPHAARAVQPAPSRLLASGALPSRAAQGTLEVSERAQVLLQAHAAQPTQPFVFVLVAHAVVRPGMALPRQPIELGLRVALETGLGF